MEAEIRYVALCGFREEGIGDVKGVFRDVDDAVAVVRKEYAEYCKAYRSIIAHMSFSKKKKDLIGCLAWGDIRFVNDRFWHCAVIECMVR